MAYSDEVVADRLVENCYRDVRAIACLEDIKQRDSWGDGWSRDARLQMRLTLAAERQADALDLIAEHLTTLVNRGG